MQHFCMLRISGIALRIEALALFLKTKRGRSYVICITRDVQLSSSLRSLLFSLVVCSVAIMWKLM